MKTLLPPAYFVVALVLMLLLHFVLPLQQVIAFPWCLFGLIPLTVGAALNLLADRAFKKEGTTVKPFEESKALVTNGVFRISRNPMYLGMAAVLFGTAVLLGSATPFLVIPTIAVLFDRIFIVPEERMLTKTFKDQFQQYRKRVRRWI